MISDLTEGQIEFNKTIFDWCLRNARRAVDRRHYIQTTRWCQLAAKVGGFGCGCLVSPELESLLLEVANQLPTFPDTVRPAGSCKRWLHVMTRTDRIGGHNALLKRWMECTLTADRHSIALLEHQDPDEKDLCNVAEASGGQFVFLGNLNSRPLESAQKLRELAWTTADYVVLHHHMWDVIPTLAFGITGGPPVLLLNMADHLFWVGASIADLVLQLRPEGQTLSEQYRGIDRNYLLNIPLPNQPSTNRDVNTAADLRQKLGIPSDCLVFLTIGREPKYEPREGVDFTATATDLLRQVPGSYFIAVGPSKENPAWCRAHEKTQGHLIPVGPQHDLRPYHMAADIYLEGFPFGSLTALLEAGLAGLPCVRAPRILPPIYRSNGPAIDYLPEPANPLGYVEQALELAGLSRADLRRMGAELSARIDHIHRIGWVDNVVQIPLPDVHQIHTKMPGIAPLPSSEAKFLRYLDGDPLRFVLWKARERGLDTSMDLRLLLAALRNLANRGWAYDSIRPFFEKPVHPPLLKSIT